MTDAVIPARHREWSPKYLARMSGAFYLFTLLTGMLAQGYISGQLVVPDDAAATAANVVAHPGLLQLGFAVYLIEMTCNVTFTVFLYELLKPVSRSISLLAATLGLVGCGIKTLSRLVFIAPLFVLGGAHYLRAFGAGQLQALALLFFKVNDQGAGIALVFFGFYALLKGYLTFRSTFLPRVLGIFGVVGGIGWLTYLYEPLASRVFPVILALGLLGAVVNVFWLLVFGVDEQRWREQARAAAASMR